MATGFVVLCIWGAILILPPLAWTALVRQDSNRFVDLYAYWAMPMGSALWIHGAMADIPPNGWGGTEPFAWVWFWTGFSADRVSNSALLVAMLVVPAVLVGIMAWNSAPKRAQEMHDRVSGEAAATGFALAVLAGMLLHHIPWFLLNEATYAFEPFWGRGPVRLGVEVDLGLYASLGLGVAGLAQACVRPTREQAPEG